MSLCVCVLLVLSSSIYFHFISTVLFLFFIISCIYLCRWSMSCVLKDVPKMYARIFLVFSSSFYQIFFVIFCNNFVQQRKNKSEDIFLEFAFEMKQKRGWTYLYSLPCFILYFKLYSSFIIIHFHRKTLTDTQ